MESEKQVTSGEGPPGRPPPPHYPSAPPPYYDSQNVYPTGPLPPPNGAPAPGGPYYPSPPAYPQAYPAGYPPGCPPGYGPPAPPAAPPMYPSGPSLYPDVSQLPQPEAGNVSFAGSAYGDPHRQSLHGSVPYVSMVPHQYGGPPYTSTVPYQHGLHSGQPDLSALPNQNGLHDVPRASKRHHQLGHLDGAPHPTTGHHQYGLYGDMPWYGLAASQAAGGDPACRVGPGHGSVPTYGSEAPSTLPSAPGDPPPPPPLPYDASPISQTLAYTTHISQAYLSTHDPADLTSAPTSSDTTRTKSPVPLGFMHGGVGSSGAPLHNPPCTDPLTPVRPAPPPPDQSSWAQNPASPSPPILSSGGPEQRPSTPLKDGQPPPGCVVAWRGGDGLQVFFLQSEGHIVSPHKPLMLSVYKRIGGRPFEGDENLLGMLEVPGCCRLKLEGKTTFALHTSGNSYIFIDKSTCPKRMVVLQLPADVSKTMQADLLALINELTDLREEQEGIAEKITTGVGTAYTDLTKKLNTVVKDTVPGAHKSTKWLRKGTGSLVRMGGSAVSKGIHVIADHIPVGEQPKEESPAHTELLAALRQFKKSKEEGSITYV
ncbi:uncharacterized protein [Panulirus ornatus]|uniref:uncharacterized protein isoform X2 n=1 Tax=Panulirus ornatus TaxID=150431 RepID=UPI003A874138